MHIPKNPLLQPFYPALDGLRAIAILLVFIEHYGIFLADSSILKWGWIGVDLFFVLSGFLITGILYDTLRKPDYFRNFYIRRALRIFPIFYGFWIALLVLSPFVHVGWNRYLWTSVTYTANFFSVGARLGWHGSPYTVTISIGHHKLPSIEIGHIWSLCVEEQFYLVWPMIIWLIRSRRALFKLCIAIVVMTPLLRSVLFEYGSRRTFIDVAFLFNSTITRMDTLLIGAAIALWLRGPAISMQTMRRIRLALCIIPALTMAFILRMWNHWPVDALNPLIDTIGLSLTALISAGVLLIAIDNSSFLSRMLNLRPLIAIGRLSYGIYFIHDLFIDAFLGHTAKHLLNRLMPAVPFVAFALTYAAAWLSFRYIESPFLRLKDRLAPRPGGVSDPPPVSDAPSPMNPSREVIHPAA